ncbi:MAG: hypothetical protein HFF49_14420 [Lawsonibacter sp.]|jgi:hypothetical protein|nr:hypothetical protein [Lawsonibacter sp.]
MDKTENGGQSLVFPIVLKASTDMMIAGWLFCGFFSLVMLLFGLIMGAWTVCGLAVLILAAYGIILYGQKRKAFIFERDQVTVQTAFSQVSYSYEGMDALICRSVTMNLSRSNWSARPALALCRKGKKLVWVPLSWLTAPEFQQAVAWVEQLPIPRRYI